MRDDIAEVQDQQRILADRFKRDMTQIKALLQQIAIATLGGGELFESLYILGTF